MASVKRNSHHQAQVLNNRGAVVVLCGFVPGAERCGFDAALPSAADPDLTGAISYRNGKDPRHTCQVVELQHTPSATVAQTQDGVGRLFPWTAKSTCRDFQGLGEIGFGLYLTTAPKASRSRNWHVS
uniref:Uncharacterized protein n=1 Tax=Anopheles melas TaxID=34690 RepID=A0A182TID9_9DIPT